MSDKPFNPDTGLEPIREALRGEPDTLTPHPAVKELLRNIQTEIGACRVLFPYTDIERAHNNACELAYTIVQNYREGLGLFQITRKLASR